MATPVTKRMHMSAYKKNSIAKQTTQSETGYYVKDGKRYKYDASATPGTKAAGAMLTNGGSEEFKKAFAAARKAGKKEFTFEGKKYTTRLKGEKEKKPLFTGKGIKKNINLSMPELSGRSQSQDSDHSTPYFEPRAPQNHHLRGHKQHQRPFHR